jgi:FAD/FMN-containing dehydrogenase
LIFPPSKIDECISLTCKLNENEVPSSKGKLQLAFIFTSPPPANTPTPLFFLFYDGPEAIGRSLCACLYDLGPLVDTTATIPYPTVNTFFNEQVRDKYQRHGCSSARLPLPLSPQILKHAWESYTTTIPNYADSWHSNIVTELRYLSPGLANSKEAMAFAGRGNWTNIVVHPIWDSPDYDVELRAWAKDLTTWVHKKTKEGAGEGEAVFYANYGSGDEKSAELFGVNYGRLRELKRKFDPGCLFNKWYPITIGD